MHPTYLKVFGWLFAGFMVCLVAYILLLELGPNPGDTHTGMVIQSAGQKIIVYISIGIVGIQSRGALRRLQRQAPQIESLSSTSDN